MDIEKVSEITVAISKIFEEGTESENTIQDLKGLLQKGSMKYSIGGLCYQLHTVVERYSNSMQFLPVLNLILEAIVMIDNEKNEALVSLYWYYVYICEYEVVDEISDFIVSLDIDYTVSFSWPWVGIDAIERRYNKIITAKNMVSEDREKREYLIHKITVKIEQAPVSALVPTVLYARGLGDLETESWLLRFVWKKLNTKGISKRLGQVCGYDISEEARLIGPEKRGKWISEKLNVCMKFCYDKVTTSEDVQCVKDVYTIQPFNAVVINALIWISARRKDTDILRMLEHGIGGTTTYISLGQFLTEALTVGSQKASAIILERIGKLKMYATILHTLENISFRKLRKNQDSRKCILMCLDFYNTVTPKRERDKYKVSDLRDKYEGVVYDNGIYLKMKNSFKENEEASILYEKKDYDALMNILLKSAKISIKTAKIILKAAIELRSPTRILSAYELLASIDPSEASFYNSDVEPFFIMVRKHEKPNWTSNSLVSRMWGNPLKFIEAIDRRTAIMAIPVKEVDASE